MFSPNASTIESSRAPETSRRWLAAALLLGAAVRFHGLGSVFPVNDEYFGFFTSLTRGGLAGLLAANPHHMLLDPLQSALVGMLGDSLALLRLPSALWGVAAVYGVWRLAKPELGPRRAGPAAVLTAVSLLHVDWSRRADFYALLAALPAFQAAALLRLGREPGGWKPYALWNALFLYSHPYAVLTPALHAVVLKGRPARLSALKAWACAGAAFLPWFFFSARAAAFGLPRLDFSGVPGTLSLGQFLARLPLFLGQAPEVGAGREWGWTLGSALSAAYAALFLCAVLRPGPRGPLLRLCRWTVPLGAAAIICLDLAYGYFFSPRQTLWLLPFYLILVADGAVWLLERLRAPGAAPALAAALVLSWLPLYLDATRLQTELSARFEAVGTRFSQLARPGDELGFGNDALLMGFLFHYDRTAFAAGADGFDKLGGAQRWIGWKVRAPLRASRGAAHNAVRLFVPGPVPERPGLWRIEGSLYDFTVRPPPDAPAF